MADEKSLTIRESGPTVIVPRTLDEMIALAERIAKSNLLPEELRGKVPEVLMQIMAGQELGLHSMASLRSFHIIKGKPVMSADAMVAVVLGSGKAEYFRRVGEGSTTSVTYETKRKGQEPQRCTWTHEMAKAAGLHQKDTWRAFERQMLAGRAKSELARDVYPDVLAGCYSIDEVEDRPRDVRTDVIDAEFVDAPSAPVEVAALTSIDEAPTLDALTALIPQLKELTGAVLLEGRRRYNARKAQLEKQLVELQLAANAAPTQPRTSSAGVSGSGATSANGCATPSSASTSGDAPAPEAVP